MFADMITSQATHETTKIGHTAREEARSSPATSEKIGHDDVVDQAYVFLTNTAVDQALASSVNLAALRRKIDWHIVPIMFLVYTMNLIDKVAYNVSDSTNQRSRSPQR